MFIFCRFVTHILVSPTTYKKTSNPQTKFRNLVQLIDEFSKPDLLIFISKLGNIKMLSKKNLLDGLWEPEGLRPMSESCRPDRQLVMFILHKTRNTARLNRR